MGAHLHVVPDPEPDEAPGPGERPVLVPAPAAAVIAPRRAPEPDTDRDQHDDADDETAAHGPDEADEDYVQDHEDPDEAGECDDEDDAGEYDEEAPASRGYMTVPDLRPYIDPRPLRELGPLAVEAGKTAGPPLLRAIGRFLRELGQMLAWYGRGIGVLLVLLAGWLSGKYGKRGSLGARFAVVAFLLYAAVRLTIQYPYTPWIIGALLLTVTVLAATGNIEIPMSKTTKKDADKGKAAKEKADQAPAKDKTPPAEDSPEGAVEEVPEVSKEKPAQASRASWATRLFRRPAPPADAPDAPPAGTPAEGGEEEPTETPADPSPEAVIRALHHLYRGGSGVLHTTLRDHLRVADTRTVKRLLDEAGITYRNGVRSPAGNGPGTHHQDFPPLPSSQEDPQGVGVVAGQNANTNTNNAERGPEEGFGAQGNKWTAEEIARGFRSIPDPDPERGPCAWKIEQYPGS
ncbi:hypothetical protein J7E96_28395 [Streptomyces sp. ISL-96]|uniref:hypothetical protein n=1 Tax=Streptomyces sp. ISL-96 TaxID=2819191 RepID=UPI001BEC95B9|nr:hypothetical protein [Streptomyces sp. ISL-96]MBT2492361.1 hypothetical protein [Streptomyces sp. ISL-96]